MAVRAAFEHAGPVYVRLGKNGEPALHSKGYDFKIGRAVEMHSGSDATIIVAGFVTTLALKAAEQLAKTGTSVRVLNMHTIKPIDQDAVLRAARETHAIVTVEEHSIIGGLGSAVAEVLAESGIGMPFQRIGVQDSFCHGVGSQSYHLQRHGIEADAIGDKILGLLDRKRVTARNT